MKKIVFILTAVFITSCSSSRVCGGSGGKRCVEASQKISTDKIT